MAENREKENVKEVEAEEIKTHDDIARSHRMKVVGFIIAGIGIMIVISMIWSMMFSGGRQKTRRRQVTGTGKQEVNKMVPEKLYEKNWQTNIEIEMEELKKNIQALTRQIQKMEKERKRESKKEKKRLIPSYTPPKTVPLPGEKQPTKSKEIKGRVKKKVPTYKKYPTYQRRPRRKINEMRRFQFSYKKELEEGDVINIPLSFAVGLTLTGGDVPTMGMGDKEPQPILVNIQTDLISANNHRDDLKDCFVLGSSKGSVSAEKALVRLVKMQCRDKEGNIYTGKVKGWIVGDNGKIGINGRVVSKQGAVLAKAFMAGLLDAIGEILKTSSTTVAVSPLGSTSSVAEGSNALKFGIGSGLSASAQKLQDIYIKMAEQIYPVVEIMPGRKVTVLFEGDDTLVKKGAELEKIKEEKPKRKEQLS